MAEQNHRFKNFEHTLTSAPMHRGQRLGKKRFSWFNLIIHIIVLILTAITGYSMYKQPVFNLAMVNKPITFHQLSHFQDTLNNISNLDINIDNIENLQSRIDSLILVFDIFFIATIVSLVLSILTIIFNRMVLKIINIFTLIIMLVITFGFSIILQNIATRIANSLSQYYVSVKPDQVLTQADAINNALILLICSLALLFISLFFRNKRKRINTIQ
jgi:amino acid transporter